MKRDMDLVRDILLAVEASTGDPRGRVELSIDGRERLEVAYHVQLLADAGLLDAIERNTMGPSGYDWWPTRLTWYGHEFLDIVRDPEIWAKTRDGAIAAGGFTFDLLKDLAKGFLRKQIERHTGVEL